MNPTNEASISSEEENCLKAALAFVVLRRRVAHGLKSAASSEGRDAEKKEDGEISPIKPLFEGLLSTTHMRYHQSENDIKKNKDFIPQDQSNCEKLEYENSNDQHILSMLRVAVSMTLPLYEKVYDIPIHKDGCETRHENKHKESNKRSVDDLNDKRFFPPIYDYRSAANPAKSSYQVIDGVVIHIASLLASKLNNTSPPSEKSITSVINLITNGLFQLMFPVAIYSKSLDSSSHTCINQGDSSVSNTRVILAVCTVLHRIVYANAKLGLVGVRAVSQVLKRLYQDKCQRPFRFLDSKCNMTSAQMTSSMRKENLDESFTVCSFPKLADVIAVNFLYLLEGICALQVKNPSDDYEVRNRKQVISNQASKIIFVIQKEMHELCIPITRQEMAHFYHVESERRSLRKKKKNVAFMWNTRNISHNGEGSYWNSKNKNGETNANSKSTHVEDMMEDLFLCPAGKMLLRLFLFDILDKLAIHAT